jgi:hypothetical protein
MVVSDGQQALLRLQGLDREVYTRKREVPTVYVGCISVGAVRA